MENPKSPDFRDAESDFLGEGGPSDQRALQQGLAVLSRGLGDAKPAAAPGAARLRQAVSELPLRYAPFFRRLGELWRIPEERVVVELTRARDPASWARTLFRGMQTFAVDVDERQSGQRCRLLQFAAGARLPRHRHRGTERVLVLEGSYADSSGGEFRAGDEQVMLEDSEHDLRILGGVPCVAGVVEHGIDFAAPWLRWASKLLGSR